MLQRGASRDEVPEGRYRRAARREQARLLSLCLPALALVALLLVAPTLYLLYLSFVGEEGTTLLNYERIFSDPVYLRSLLLTLKIAFLVTVICILLGYPLCYMLLHLRPWLANLCLILVIVPFWTSLLVRSYAWMVLLQRRGLVNSALESLDLVEVPLRLMHNELGAAVGMVHIMLPFLILPLYASMRQIDSQLPLAAAALGATPLFSFWRVFFPLSLPGLLAGTVLVFVLSIGFYITPALLGGGRMLMVSMVIERNVNLFADWGSASSVAALFLLIVVCLFWLASRVLPLQAIFGQAR